MSVTLKRLTRRCDFVTNHHTALARTTGSSHFKPGPSGPKNRAVQHVLAGIEWELNCGPGKGRWYVSCLADIIVVSSVRCFLSFPSTAASTFRQCPCSSVT